MSGGYFDYQERHIREIADDIEEVICKNYVSVPDELIDIRNIHDDGTIDDWNRYYYCYSKDVIDKFKTAYWKLREAEIYAKRIDYLLDEDDGEDTFSETLEAQLKELEIEKQNKTFIYNGEKDED